MNVVTSDWLSPGSVAFLARGARGRALLESNSSAIPKGAYVVTFDPSFVTYCASRRALLPFGLDSESSPLVLSKDFTWYVATQGGGGDVERDLDASFRRRRLAVEDPSRPEGPENYSLDLLLPREGL